MDTTPNPDKTAQEPWLMRRVFSEFNSGAWLTDIGNFTAACTAGGLPKKPNKKMQIHDACSDMKSTSSAAHPTAT
jgi:hypothetical protein